MSNFKSVDFVFSFPDEINKKQLKKFFKKHLAINKNKFKNNSHVFTLTVPSAAVTAL